MVFSGGFELGCGSHNRGSDVKMTSTVGVRRINPGHPWKSGTPMEKAMERDQIRDTHQLGGKSGTPIWLAQQPMPRRLWGLPQETGRSISVRPIRLMSGRDKPVTIDQ